METEVMIDIEFYMGWAYNCASNSTDRSTKNGAVLVNPLNGVMVASGCNHHVFGYGHEKCDHARPFKYDVTEHAERDVILMAARSGIKTQGLTMVANWVACPDCARAIVLAGIRRVICHKACQDRTPAAWAGKVATGLEILRRGHVEVIEWDGVLGVKNLNNGEIWTA